MFRKSIVFGKSCLQILLPLSIVITQTIPQASAAGDTTLEQNGKSPASSSAIQQAAPSADLGLRVDDVNDLGYALQRVRQQAINIYVEAIRKRHSPEVSAELPSLTKVPAELPKDMSNLLPFRRPWLVYFVITLEPLIHLLKEDVKDIETGERKIDVSPDTRKALDPLIKEWSLGVRKIDEQLTCAMALVEDADKNNIELAKIASELDKEVSKLEDVRDKCFNIVSEMEQKWRKSSQKTN